MKISLICVGKMHEPALASLVDRFATRIPHYMPFELVVIPDVKTGKNASAQAICEREGEVILSKINPADHVVLFDERGRRLTSRAFSEFIERAATTLPRNLVFVIGGPYGFSDAVRARANGLISLSDMTFTHEMARLFATEQIYRAMTIMRGEPYHHD